MITLLQIKLEAFLSHEETTINLKENQKILLNGKSGCGKSSIIDALVWVLYGKARTDNRSLIKNGSDKAEVSLTLASDKKRFKIERSITKSGKQELNVSVAAGNLKKKAAFKPVEVVGIKNIQHFIEHDILNSSYLLFINSIVYPQDNVESFVKQTAVKRKEILLEIVRAADYDEYYDKTKDIIGDFNSKVEFFNAEIELQTHTIEVQQKIADQLPDLEKKKEGLKITFIHKQAEIETIDCTLRANDKLKDKSTWLKTTVDEIGKKLERSNLLLQHYKQKISEANSNEKLEKLIKELSGLGNLEVNKALLAESKATERRITEWSVKKMQINVPALFDYDTAIAEINKQLISILSKKAPYCSVLGKECSVIVDEQDARKKELEERLDYNIESKKVQDNLIKERDDKIKALGVCPTIDYTAVNTLEKTIKKQEDIKREMEDHIRDNENEKKNLELSLKATQEEFTASNKEFLDKSLELGNLLKETLPPEREKLLQDKLSLVKLAQQVDHNEITDTEAHILQAKSAITAVEAAKKELIASMTEQTVLNEKLEDLALLKDAFGNAGIKAMIIDYTIPRLEDKINEILGKLSDFKIRLNTQKSTISGESVMEGLYIDIINGQGEIFDYQSYSGGEKVKISSAIFEGLASLQNCNFRVLDESIISLDAESTSQFIEILENIQRTISQLIVVSHIPEVKDCFEDKIEIIKINGNSKIVNS